jgi:hypothetical protein
MPLFEFWDFGRIMAIGRKLKTILHRKKIVSVVAANQVFVVVTKSTGTASTVSASAKLAARVVANIMPPNVAELAAVLAANSNDAVSIYAVVTTWIRNQDGD